MISISFTSLIIFINIFIFILWHILGNIYPNFMISNFLVSWDSLIHGKIWTLLTSAFSHTMLWHLLINMFVLFNFGVIVENQLGSLRFIVFYIAAGIAGSLLHCIVCSYILHQPNLLALGASGAISGVILIFSLYNPNQLIFLFGIIPLPAIWAVILFNGLDIWGLINQTRGIPSPIGYGAHLGGALAGLIYFGILRLKDSAINH